MSRFEKRIAPSLSRISVTAVVLAAVAVAAIALHALYTEGTGHAWVSAFNPDYHGFLLAFGILQQITSLVAGALALIVIWRAGDSIATRTFALSLAFLALNWATVVNTAGLPRDSILGLWSFANAFSIAGFVHFTLVFPRRLTQGDLALTHQQESVPLGRLGRVGVAGRLFMLRGVNLMLPRAGFGIATHEFRPLRALQATAIDRPALVWLCGVAVAAYWYQLAGWLWREDRMMGMYPTTVAAFVGLLFGILILLTPLAMVVSSLRISYAASTDEERRKILWIVEACVLALSALLAVFALAVLSYVTNSAVVRFVAELGFLIGMPLIYLAFLACLAIAMFYSGAIDPALVLRRTAVYGSLGVILIFLFAGVEDLMAQRLAGLLGLPASSSTWIASGTVALAFALLQKRVKRVVDRFSQRERAR
jgi:hypothetical protein